MAVQRTTALTNRTFGVAQAIAEERAKNGNTGLAMWVDTHPVETRVHFRTGVLAANSVDVINAGKQWLRHLPFPIPFWFTIKVARWRDGNDYTSITAGRWWYQEIAIRQMVARLIPTSLKWWKTEPRTAG